MGFLVKSAIGLGCVYFAMFGQPLQSADLAPTANLCQSAAKAGLTGDAISRAAGVAGCAVAIGTVSERLAAAAPAPRPASKRAAGTLSADDLRAPWFGPERIQRKTDRRG
jgi:hypothetical protein